MATSGHERSRAFTSGHRAPESLPVMEGRCLMDPPFEQSMHYIQRKTNAFFSPKLCSYICVLLSKSRVFIEYSLKSTFIPNRIRPQETKGVSH